MSHALVHRALMQAIEQPTRVDLLAHHYVDRRSNATALLRRLRDNLQAMIDRTELAAGDYTLDVPIGMRAVQIRVRVQADLFGPPSINIDTAQFDEAIERG